MYKISEDATLTQLSEIMAKIWDTKVAKSHLKKFINMISNKALMTAQKPPTPLNPKLTSSDAVVASNDDGLENLIQDKDKIKRIILENTVPDRYFYPDEIAFKFNLDLKTTMQVMRTLIDDGVVYE